MDRTDVYRRRARLLREAFLKLLLDTQVVIWLAYGDADLPARVRDYIARSDHALYVSVVSAWEYGIKRSRCPHQLREPFHELLTSEYRRLDLGFEIHSFAEDLPTIHRDPFDRMLIAQALSLDLTLVTADKIMRRYPVSTYW